MVACYCSYGIISSFALLLFVFSIIDIVISAPFEGSGVVYIFNGRIGSVNTKYSQKIIGKSIHPGIMSFGLFISESRDMDANGFPGKTH